MENQPQRAYPDWMSLTPERFRETSGAGTWGPPGRVATDNEVVEINMVFQK